MEYILNVVSFISTTIFIVYYLIGLVLKFFKYNTLHDKLYMKHPIMYVLFLMSVANVLEVIHIGIKTEHCTLGTMVIITLLLFIGIFGLLQVLKKVFNIIQKIRSKFPER